MRPSLIVPSYNEEENVRPFYETVKAVNRLLHQTYALNME